MNTARLIRGPVAVVERALDPMRAARNAAHAAADLAERVREQQRIDDAVAARYIEARAAGRHDRTLHQVP